MEDVRRLAMPSIKRGPRDAAAEKWVPHFAGQLKFVVYTYVQGGKRPSLSIFIIFKEEFR
jgi:hypothetical protein